MLKQIGAATCVAYGLSYMCNGHQKTMAYAKAIPRALACLPALIAKQVHDKGPYAPRKNIFSNMDEIF
jgi:hypothetical protein